MLSTIAARAACTGLSLAILTATGSATAHAAGAEPCAKQQATVMRHQQTFDQMNKRIELLDETYRDADATADHAFIEYYEWRDAARSGELSDTETADAQKKSAEAHSLYLTASAQAKEARTELTAAESDPQLKKTATLLKRARTALATCLAKNA